ncbi:hypothetical protein H4R26_004541 [Coemansia thaxteri]|uniref:carboxypeptidase C n=1 Tax=Coemansia thaxteri TaxID=2663907 RepID=A0A9W8EDI7_9FUNG|nr:hypothetical protein H4R26_004541 [Coemansia thaxteri]
MELGPCRVSAGGNHTENNAYAWNQNAHLLFIDQPLNSGFSYGQRVDNSYDAAKDIDVFLRMFYRDKRVNLDFLTTGDWVKPIHLEIPPLLEAGLRVLIYSGDADWICNWYGGKAWSLAMDWSGKSEFAAALDRPWLVDGEQAGESRTAGNFTFVRVFGAGHMVPYDQPKASLDMVNSWISNQSKF